MDIVKEEESVKDDVVVVDDVSIYSCANIFQLANRTESEGKHCNDSTISMKQQPNPIIQMQRNLIDVENVPQSDIIIYINRCNASMECLFCSSI